jgi:hypothetical protein
MIVVPNKSFLVLTFLLVSSCQGQVAAGGTIVAVLPANGGVVIAADSRLTLGGNGCDGFQKLLIPPTRKHTVVFTTGYPLRYKNAVSTTDCEAAMKAPLALDMGKFIEREVEKGVGPLTKKEVHKIANLSVSRVEEYAKNSRPHALHGDIGRKDCMFRGGVVNYDVKNETTIVGMFCVSVSPDEKPFIDGDITYERHPKTESTGVQIIGETDYFNANVFSEKNGLLNPYFALFPHNSPKVVSDSPIPDARQAVLSVVAATEVMTKTVRAPSEIGGPIDEVTITSKPTALTRFPSY